MHKFIPTTLAMSSLILLASGCNKAAWKEGKENVVEGAQTVKEKTIEGAKIVKEKSIEWGREIKDAFIKDEDEESTYEDDLNSTALLYKTEDLYQQVQWASRKLMNRWFQRTGHNPEQQGRPQLIIAEIDNRADTYLPPTIVRAIFQDVAAEDGRYISVESPVVEASERVNRYRVPAPILMATVRLAKNGEKKDGSRYENYRLSITLFDEGNERALDTAWSDIEKVSHG